MVRFVRFYVFEYMSMILSTYKYVGTYMWRNEFSMLLVHAKGGF